MPPFAVRRMLRRVNAARLCHRKPLSGRRQPVNAQNLNQLQSSQILIDLESSIDRVERSFYLYSSQLYLPYLAAAQNVCAKRGPNKKRGPQCSGSGEKDWRLPSSCWGSLGRPGPGPSARAPSSSGRRRAIRMYGSRLATIGLHPPPPAPADNKEITGPATR